MDGVGHLDGVGHWLDLVLGWLWLLDGCPIDGVGHLKCVVDGVGHLYCVVDLDFVDHWIALVTWMTMVTR